MPGSGGFDIDQYSGLSTYIPSMGDSTCDATYRELAWNKATGYLK